jgi:hypothetical protein
MRVLSLLLVAGIAHADPEVATVQVLREGIGGDGSGAVFRADKGESYVLTNKHVAPAPNRVYKVRSAGKVHDAEWVATDAGCDLALLRVRAALVSIPLADAEPAPGTAVRVYGYGGFPKAGTVVGPDPFGGRIPGTGEIWRVSFVPEPGDSGSPVIADGKLVGVLWGTAGHDGRTCAVRLHEIRGFLSRHTGVKAATGTPAAVAGPLREMPPLSKDK